MPELVTPPLPEVMTPLRRKLAAIDVALPAGPTARQCSTAIHAIIKLIDDMEVTRIKDFRDSIKEVL